ncbi:metal ABC transporter permease [Arenibaculum sp.]|jgi:manganese/zinc/iron transport system permease protein|uniref:metal ABC transporter permease n=1 Tax=Arenibaculum sp. TaxID=2865862 RepID=UPI002E0D3018|nr:metal ABC transporter permease [Arenibaculum sp.]
MLQELLLDIPLTIMATGALVGTAATLVGVFLVLRGNSMLSDAISHSIVFGIVLVWLLTRQQSGPVQILGAALAGVLTVFLTELLARTRRVKDDAAIGLVFPALFSTGVLLLNVYARDIHLDVHAVLLGEIGFVWLDTVTVASLDVPRALVWMAAAAAANGAFVVLFFKELKLSTFDRDLAAALGFAPAALSYALLTLTSTTAVAAFDAVGAVLFIAFVIVPPSAAYLLTDRLTHMLAIGIAISVASSVLGYHAAVLLDVSIGGMMAVVTGLFLLAAFLFGPRYGVVARSWKLLGQRRVNESRLLALYLHDRGGGPQGAVAAALRDRLRWDAGKTAAVIRRSRRLGLVAPEGEVLRLTEQGRRAALELLEPWNAG